MSTNSPSLNLLHPCGACPVCKGTASQYKIWFHVRSGESDLRTAHLGYCTTHVWSHTHHTCQLTNKFLLKYVQIIMVIKLMTLELRRLFKRPLFVLLLHWWSRLSPLLRKRTIYPPVLSIRAPWQVSTSCWTSVATDCQLTAGHEASNTVGRLVGSTAVYVLPTQCIYYVFCVDLRTNSDYFPIKH